MRFKCEDKDKRENMHYSGVVNFQKAEIFGKLGFQEVTV